MKATHWLLVGILVGAAGFLLVRELSAPMTGALVQRLVETYPTVWGTSTDLRALPGSMATLAGVVVGLALFGICAWMAARQRHQAINYVLRLGAAGFFVGLVVGILTRPSVPLIGQLPIEVVFTRGAKLSGMDLLLLRSTAESSFNYIAVVMIVGTLAGAVLGWFVGHRRAAESSVQQALPVSAAVAADLPLENGSRVSTVGRDSYCIKCGRKLPHVAAYCPDCGTKVTGCG